MQKTTIQLKKSTVARLKEMGTMNDTYDTAILKLIEEHERMRRIDLLVDTQHKIAKEGRFVEVD